MHLIDLMWGILAVAAAAVPAYRLFDNRHRPGACCLFGLVLVCAMYPWAYIVYPYTFFDQGLVFLFSSWITSTKTMSSSVSCCRIRSVRIMPCYARI